MPVQETWVRSLGREDPLEEEMAPTPAFLPGESQDRGAWQATVHGVTKSQTRLSDWACTHGRTDAAGRWAFTVSSLWADPWPAHEAGRGSSLAGPEVTPARLEAKLLGPGSNLLLICVHRRHSVHFPSKEKLQNFKLKKMPGQVLKTPHLPRSSFTSLTFSHIMHTQTWQFWILRNTDD